VCVAFQEVLLRRAAGAAQKAVLLEDERMRVITKGDVAADDFFG
jgi:hypothetical protein